MNIISFDIEDWFHYQKNFDSNKDFWLKRLDSILNNILDKLDEKELKATFFCLGYLAREFPDVIRTISDRGHEIASHSDMHYWLTSLTPEAFDKDTRLSIDSLQQLIGKKIKGYRAPAFSIGNENKWTLEILKDNGIEYDCSIFPTSRDFGGFPEFGQQEPTYIKYKGLTIKEFPINTISFLGKQIAYSGGGYFRLIPYPIIKRTVNSRSYVMSYFHIRDFDAQQKKIISKRYLKDYLCINGAYNKFCIFLSEFDFVNVETADKMIDWEKQPIVFL